VTPILESRGLTKRFGRIQALAGLDLVIRRGRVVALLGPNGAGKTTFVRAVATLLRPDAGTLRVAGIDALRQPARVRQVIGSAGQFAAVEPAMTGRENLEMVGYLFGLSRRRVRAAARRSSTSCKSPMSPTGSFAPTQPDCAAVSTWVSAWSGHLACSCSTSRRRAWTPAAAFSCGTRSASSSPRAQTCC
jgi:ABC-type sugar transport system ATPase subunit